MASGIELARGLEGAPGWYRPCFLWARAHRARPSPESSMTTRSIAAAGILTLASIVAGTPARAQATRRAVSSSTTGSLFDVTTYAGYMIFGDYLSGPLGTSLTNAPAPI